MKKLVKLTAVGLSCALAFSLAACGGDDDGNNPADNAPNPNDVKTEQVTEAEWQNAFDFSSVTNVTFKRSVVDSALASLPSSVLPNGAEQFRIAKFDGDKISVARKEYEIDSSSPAYSKFVDETKYYYSDNGVNYVYTYNESSKKYDKEEMADGDNFPETAYYTNMVTGWGTLYDNFEYSSSKGAYYFKEVNDNGQGQVITNECIIKITDGKLSVYQYLETVELAGISPSTTTVTLQAYDYGNTKVALPDGSGDEDEGEGEGGSSGSEVTEAQWNAALSAEAFYNVTLDVTMKAGGEEMSQTSKYDYSTGCVLKESTDYSSLSAYSDKGVSQYSLSDGEWQLNGSYDGYTFERDIQQTIISTVSVFKYNAFTYKDGMYTALKYTSEGMDGIVVDYVNMAFENGRLVRCEYSANISDVQSTMIMIFSDYAKTTVKRPDGGSSEEGGNDGPSDGEWNTALNGVYYRYYDGEYDYKTFLEIHDGNIKTSFGTPAKIEINGTDIRVTFEMQDDEYGNIIQVFEGTIKDGVINFTYLAAYDEKGALITEQKGSTECYRKDKE